MHERYTHVWPSSLEILPKTRPGDELDRMEVTDCESRIQNRFDPKPLTSGLFPKGMRNRQPSRTSTSAGIHYSPLQKHFENEWRRENFRKLIFSKVNRCNDFFFLNSHPPSLLSIRNQFQRISLKSRARLLPCESFGSYRIAGRQDNSSKASSTSCVTTSPDYKTGHRTLKDVHWYHPARKWESALSSQYKFFPWC